MDFDSHVKARMEKGALEYGDASWTRPKVEIVGEMLQEPADVGGWGLIALDGPELGEPDSADRLKIRYAIRYARMAWDMIYSVYKHLGG